MKKLITILFSLLALGLAATSCDDDDNTSNNTRSELVGKWGYSKEEKGDGPLTDYQHFQGCNKDYMEFSAQSVKDVRHYTNGIECANISHTASYTRNGNTLTVEGGTLSFSGTIEKLTATELIISELETQNGVTIKYINTYTKG